jgi:ATP adenylyltransferase
VISGRFLFAEKNRGDRIADIQLPSQYAILAPDRNHLRTHPMDYLWTPWRFTYMAQASSAKQPECVFCAALARQQDDEALIVFRGKKVFVILNRFPYTSGHVMIVPYAHVAELHLVEPEGLQEMMALAQRVEAVYKSAYKPDGMNLGMNLGRAAGAGVTGHLHLHMLPRWIGDSNFMTVTGETRVQPEDLKTTYEKLATALKT